MTGPRRQVAGSLAACLVIAGLAWLVGVTAMGALLIGLLVAALVPFLLYPLDDGDTLPPVASGSRHGARVEVSRLSWAMGTRRGYLDPRVVRRLRSTAYRRLADLHLDPKDPKQAATVEMALGSWAYDVVTGDRTDLGSREIVRLVDAIERLGSQRQRGAGQGGQRGAVTTEEVRRSRW